MAGRAACQARSSVLTNCHSSPLRRMKKCADTQAAQALK
jgi:hypothetical protein